MTEGTGTTAPIGRIHWMDNLRTVIILLVVLYHVGGVYEAAGLWAGFWIVDDPATIGWVGIMGIIFDIFVMSTLFFISGYLTPTSVDSKTAREFIKARFKRLIIPWAIAVWTLIPLYKVIFLYSRGLPQERWATYSYLTNPNSQNWLWFLPVLFAFNMLYLLFARANIKLSTIPLKWAVAGTLTLGVAYSQLSGSFFGFRSWTLTPLLDFENERVLVYALSFWLGTLCFRQNVFAEKPKGKTLYLVASAVAWLPVTAHMVARLWPFFVPAGFTVTPLYRLLWWLSFYVSLVCLVYLMVVSFWLYVDRPGGLWRELNRNSYGVYIIHVIIIGFFGTLFLKLNLPGSVKYLFLIVATYGGSNLLVSGYRAYLSSLPGSRLWSDAA